MLVFLFIRIDISLIYCYILKGSFTLITYKEAHHVRTLNEVSDGYEEFGSHPSRGWTFGSA